MENIVFEINFGMETCGKVVKENDIFQCYETPMYGGEFYKTGLPFKDEKDAISYLKSLT